MKNLEMIVKTKSQKKIKSAAMPFHGWSPFGSTADFTGNQVMHCHYLNHEDLGCIGFMSIVAPSSSG